MGLFEMNSKQSAKRVIAVFGESHNDSQAIMHLVSALKPDLQVRAVRSPTVLIHKNAGGRNNIRRNADQIKEAIKALNVHSRVVAAVVHKDCDEIEPAHTRLSKVIEAQLAGTKYVCVAATPAWEIESWWYLWPDAVSAYHASWARLNRRGKNVGLLADAKEQLVRDLRPKGSKKTRDYVESDSVGIAEFVRKLGCVNKQDAVSDSFALFQGKIAAI